MAQWTPPPKPSSPSSLSSASILKIPSSADDPGFILRYHHIALTKLRGVKEMNGTRIEALHARELSASTWPPPSLPRGRLTTDLPQMLGVGVLHPAVLNCGRTYLFTLLNLGNRSAHTPGFGRQPRLTPVQSGVLIHLTGIVGLRKALLSGALPSLASQMAFANAFVGI